MRTLKITTVACSLLVVISAVSAIAIANRTAGGNEIEGRVSANATPRPAQEYSTTNPEQGKLKPMDDKKMQFGNFSISLAVKDLKASKAFYEKLDFQQVGGNLEHNYVIMQSGTSTVGLFQGMFEGNILTFNPGWNHKKETLEKFQDVRDLQATIKARGITPTTEADAASKGPASFVIVDPDGNAILVDQHVPKPE